MIDKPDAFTERETEMAIDLNPFCATKLDNPERPYLHNPFSDGEWTYATDGIVLVGVPVVSGMEGSLAAPRAKANALINSIVQIPFSPLSLDGLPPEPVACSTCNGRGRLHDCPDCECTCEDCDGKTPKRISVRLRGTVFNAKYLRLIASLPGPLAASIAAFPNASFFRFNGGIAVLSPMDLSTSDVELAA
jgi:hypothetical protein